VTSVKSAGFGSYLNARGRNGTHPDSALASGISPCGPWPDSAMQECVLFYLVVTWRERVEKTFLYSVPPPAKRRPAVIHAVTITVPAL